MLDLFGAAVESAARGDSELLTWSTMDGIRADWWSEGKHENFPVAEHTKMLTERKGEQVVFTGRFTLDQSGELIMVKE